MVKGLYISGLFFKCRKSWKCASRGQTHMFDLCNKIRLSGRLIKMQDLSEHIIQMHKLLGRLIIQILNIKEVIKWTIIKK